LTPGSAAGPGRPEAAPERRQAPRPLAVTFDFGQTLADLDTVYLSRRLLERGHQVAPAALELALPRAWAAYNAGIQRGQGGHPWQTLMRELLSGAGASEEACQDAVPWLRSEQPRHNLWRRPVPGMIELIKSLTVPIGIISNSEGRLEELAVELGWRPLFAAFADSGRLGIEKPDARIFDWTCARLGVPKERVIHVGDSLPADVRGAVDAGFHSAIWFRGQHDGDRFLAARDASQVGEILRASYCTTTSS